MISLPLYFARRFEPGLRIGAKPGPDKENGQWQCLREFVPRDLILGRQIDLMVKMSPDDYHSIGRAEYVAKFPVRINFDHRYVEFDNAPPRNDKMFVSALALSVGFVDFDDMIEFLRMHYGVENWWEGFVLRWAPA